jgi:hypothetical protein
MTRPEADLGGIRHITAAADAARMDTAPLPHQRRTWPWALLAVAGLLLLAVVAYTAGRWTR